MPDRGRGLITEVSRYLENLKSNLKLDPSTEEEVIHELETHVEDRFHELKDTGLSDEEAVEKCLGLLGSARLVARQIYEAHSQGTWRQALLASMPHLLFALLFTLKWLVGVSWLPVVLVGVFGIVVFGWHHGKPTWFFPWLGYSLFPVVAAGLLLLYLPAGLAWVTILLYVPLVLWLLCYVTIKSVKKDWLYSALMLLPIPTFIGWVLTVEQEVRFSGFGLEYLYDFAPWTGLSFLVLAAAVAAFFRFRKRWLKILALVSSGLVTLTMVTLSSGRLGSFAVIILAVLTVIFMFAPAWLERKIKHGDRPAET